MLDRSSPGSVSRETHEKLALFVDLIGRWNDTVPLLSRSAKAFQAHNHVADSLSLIPFLGPDVSTADLGSGAGFPGLVLAIATGRKITLIESNRRKAAFLQEAVRLTEAPAIVYPGRVESLVGTFGLITARAVAPLDTLISLVAARLASPGRLLLLKGPRVEEELRTARKGWSFEAECHPSLIQKGSIILSITNLRRAPPL